MNTLTEKKYFRFEDDFVEENVRCIPMIVRFKLDACGIKLKLSEWSRMSVEERGDLANMPCNSSEEIMAYHFYLKKLIFKRTGNEATELPIPANPAWQLDEIPLPLQEKLREFEWTISMKQWKALSDLQRFALLKLSYPGHENRNFPRAMKEFDLV